MLAIKNHNLVLKGREFFIKEKNKLRGAMINKRPLQETGSLKYNGFSLAELR